MLLYSDWSYFVLIPPVVPNLTQGEHLAIYMYIYVFGFFLSFVVTMDTKLATRLIWDFY